MKPLQKTIIKRNIAKELKERDFTWDEVFYYLRDYNDNVIYHSEYNGDIGTYIIDALTSMTDEQLSAIHNELNGGIRSNDAIEDTDSNAECWRNGYLRVFISHLTENKESATFLKQSLANYGIDCFVAHEDIEPSKLWQAEIEKALVSMDLLCAILTPNFYQSKWCDQEVGIALGRTVPTLSIKKGADPHGFIGKYQAIKAKPTAEAVAKDVFDTICKMGNINQKYFTILGKLFLNSKNEKEALDWIKLINRVTNFSEEIIDKIAASFDQNSILNSKAIINEYNKLAKKFQRPELSLVSSIEINDLPF